MICCLAAGAKSATQPVLVEVLVVVLEEWLECLREIGSASGFSNATACHGVVFGRERR